MPSVAEELAALRKQSLAKDRASKLKDVGGLSTPEQEAQQIKAQNEKTRTANYTKQAKESLNAGTTAVDQDLEFKRKLAAAKKDDKQKQSDAKQSLAAGTKAVDKTLEFQQQSKAMKKADQEKQKEAVENLQSFNEAKSSGSKLSAPPPVSTAAKSASGPVPVANSPSAPAPPDVEEEEEVQYDIPPIEEMDDIPILEEVTANDMPEMPPSVGDMPAAAATPGPRVQNRAEKKARKMMERLNMRRISGISRITLKTAAGNQGFFTIHQPDVFEKNGSFVVFGEATQGTGMMQQQQQQAKAAQELATATTAAAPSTAPAEGVAGEREIVNDEQGAVDESGIEAKDIDLVIQQAGCTRASAVAALKENDGDLVNAIMSLTK